jgi:hypothetical protein
VNQRTEHMDEVDVHPAVHTATEPDEREVLERLYGAPDLDGYFRGPPLGEEAKER